MKLIRDDVQLNKLALPGTHESATFDVNLYPVVSDIVQTQVLSFDEQLKCGIRVFDLPRQPRQHTLEIRIRIMPVHASRLDQAHDRHRPFTAAQRSDEQPIGTSKRPRPDRVFHRGIVYGHSTIIQVARQRYPAFQAVV